MISQNRVFAALAAAISLFLASCAGVSPYRYWNVFEMTEPAVSSDKSFTDDKISVRFYIDEKKIHFRMVNRAGKPLKIEWDRAEYIHIDGVRHKACNSESVFTRMRENPPPTTIHPGEAVNDFVVPVKNVMKIEEWTWYVYPLFNLFDERALDAKGKTIGIDLPVQIGEETNVYKFRFAITNVIPGIRLM